jgi:hypothetical protein
VSDWRYFIATDPGESPAVADQGEAGLLRLPAGGSVSLAEAVVKPGEWIPTDIMWRERYRGSGAWEFHEIPAGRAHDLLRRFVELGRLDRLPDDASAITPEQARALADRDRESAAQWSNVQKPPGADDIRF